MRIIRVNVFIILHYVRRNPGRSRRRRRFTILLYARVSHYYFPRRRRVVRGDQYTTAAAAAVGTTTTTQKKKRLVKRALLRHYAVREISYCCRYVLVLRLLLVCIMRCYNNRTEYIHAPQSNLYTKGCCSGGAQPFPILCPWVSLFVRVDDNISNAIHA